MNAPIANSLARCLRDFFADYLPGLRGMSHHTIHSYRDALVLLLRFLATNKQCEPIKLDLSDIDPSTVIAFLNYLEKERGNSVATRNIRLAAIHAFLRYVAAHAPEHLERAQRIVAIPFKRTATRVIDYFDYDEICTILEHIDRTTILGRRDYALLATMFNTGARVQETIDIRRDDLSLERPYQVRLHGKGRKTRYCPLWPQTAAVLRELCRERQLMSDSAAFVFVNHRGTPLTRFGVRYVLSKHCRNAQHIAPSLANKRLHPHSLRHSTAIHLLNSGVDLISISHWLGHASPNTTSRYATLDLEMKRAAIAKAKSPDDQTSSTPPWKTDISIMTWLQSL